LLKEVDLLLTSSIREAAKALIQRLSCYPNINGGYLNLHPWLSVPRSNIPDLLRVLEQWSSPTDTSPREYRKQYPNVYPPTPPCFRAVDRDSLSPVEDQFRELVNSWLGTNFEITEEYTRTHSDPYQDTDAELKLFKRAGILLPAPELMARHPVLRRLLASREVSEEILERLREAEVFTSWDCNITFFVRASFYAEIFLF
jgi:hypothetical protein